MMNTKGFELALEPVTWNGMVFQWMARILPDLDFSILDRRRRPLAVFGFSELTLVTRQAAGATKAYMLFFCAAGLLYLALTLVSNLVIGRIERYARRGMPELT